MRNINKIFLIAGLALGIASCKKNWLDVNTNPNNPTQSETPLVFSNAVNTSVGTVIPTTGSTGNTLIAQEMSAYWCGHWAQSSSYQVSAPLMQYVFTNATWTYWTNWYDNLTDYEYVIANSGADPAFAGFSKVMKALVYQRLVDFYGDVPFKQAHQPATFPRPAYDNAEAIYTDLIVLLDGAVADINAAPSVNGVNKKQDIVFNGDKAKWVRLANTVKMRILMRQSRIASKAAYITAEVNKVIAGGGVLKAGEIAFVNPGYISGTAGKNNPIYNQWGFTENGATATGSQRTKVSQYLINTLKPINDFRFSTIAAPIAGANPNSAASYVGAPLGINDPNYVSARTSSLGENVIKEGEMTRPVCLISAAEAQFLMAEATFLFPTINTTTTAEDFYIAGVTESFLQNTFEAVDATDYMAQNLNNVTYASSTNKLNAIMFQKWIALANFDGIEAWAEQRKSNVPADAAVKTIGQTTAPNAPVRLPYPLVEISTNAANVPQGINVYSNRLFWDLN